MVEIRIEDRIVIPDSLASQSDLFYCGLCYEVLSEEKQHLSAPNARIHFTVVHA